MKMEEYLQAVTAQIRCVQARDLVSEELRDHIEDQTEAYMAEGMFEDDACERAVRDMGDPVEVGVSLDRVHRPRMSVGMLVLVAVIGILGIASHGYGMYGFQEHIRYTVLGCIVMLIVCRLDYSILGLYGKQLAAAFLTFTLVGGTLFVRTLNGRAIYIYLGLFKIFIPAWMYLYVPLFAAVLYAYRKEGYRALFKIALWAVIPLFFVLRLPDLSLAVQLGGAMLLLVSVAVWKNWYAVSRKKVLTVIWGMALLSPAVLFGILYVTGNLAGYQAARLHAFLANSGDMNYTVNNIREFLRSSYLLGMHERNIAEMAAHVPGLENDYIFAGIISMYGILAGILIVVLFICLIGRIFHISLGQKNQLGMIVGCSCGMVLLVQVVLSVFANLCLVPPVSTILPFFSSGGSQIVVSYTLMGLVLSVYRYKNILSERKLRSRGKITIRIERSEADDSRSIKEQRCHLF